MSGGVSYQLTRTVSILVMMVMVKTMRMKRLLLQVASPSLQSRSKRTIDDTPARREEDAHERRMADISSVKRREAKVQGHAYLGEEELQRELAQLLRNIS